MKEISYFTCTLGQAALLNQKKPYRTIPEFIDHQAERSPDLPAVGSYVITEQDAQWRKLILTYRQIQHGTRVVAERLRSKTTCSTGETVALLAPSSLEFLFVWLGMMYLGCPVLLIAPQCSASAVAHLCNACKVTTLFRDEKCAELGGDACKEALSSGGRLEAIDLPFDDSDEVFNLAAIAVSSSESRHADASQHDVAYLHHTSGTSSGVPKPIPQTHHGGLCVLPRLAGSKHATFTTTPLYHGGIADLFRAWTSDALIWLFPGKDIPITARNVVRCLDISATNQEDDTLLPQVKYFSSVPYVLQMLAADKSGLDHLRNMSMVGVGGAALPLEAGNALVEQGINLVSRFGSAECGFLLSSDRDFITDKEWQYLRHDPEVKQLAFRTSATDDGVSELVVQPGWPHMAKTNRGDGSFATSDLFESHPSLSHAWRYHSRADSQLTLVTGKKFDPAPLEADISAMSDIISDAMVFGEGEAYPGVLLFRSKDAASLSDGDLLQKLRPMIDKMNNDAQSHARIPLDMLVPMPPIDLEKSSKGTLVRSALSNRFASFIETAYRGDNAGDVDTIPDEDVVGSILKDILTLLPSAGDLTADTDLFTHGVDSVASMQIRNKLSRLLPRNVKLPLTVVQDTGTVKRLAEHVVALRHGREASGAVEDDVTMTMQQFVNNFSNLPSTATFGGALSSPSPSPSPSAREVNASRGRTILLTGATGNLGAHLLSHLLQRQSDLGITHIYILVRDSKSKSNPEERIKAALGSRSLPIPDEPVFASLITVLPSSLTSSPSLGLDAATYRQLTESVTHIYHLAWSVNFLLPLSAYQPHFAGLQNLLHLALLCNTRPNNPTTTESTSAHRPRPRPPTHLIFCSSTASVSSYPTVITNTSTRSIPECAILSPQAAGPTGYARSKWVGEAICHAFATRHSCLSGGEAGDTGSQITIVRVGQLSGSSSTGCWNGSEAYPLMLAASRELGVVADLDGARHSQRADGAGAGAGAGGAGQEECAWIPVDVAAEAFVQLMQQVAGADNVRGGSMTTTSIPSASASASAAATVINGGDACTRRDAQDDVFGHRSDGVVLTPEVQNAPRIASDANGEMRVLHLLPKPGTHSCWTDILRDILDVEPGAFRIVPIAEWLRRLEAPRRWDEQQPNDGEQREKRQSQRQRQKQQEHEHHPALQLAGFWSEVYGATSQPTGRGDESFVVSAGEDALIATTSGFEMQRSLEAMPVLATHPSAVHLENEYIARCWRWIKENV